MQADIFLAHTFFSNRLSRHLLYWVAYVFLFTILWGLQDLDFKKSFILELINLPLKIVLVYFCLEVLMPEYLFKRKFFLFFLFLFLTLILIALLQRVVDNTIVLHYFFTDWERFSVLNLPLIIVTIFKMGIVLVLPSLIKTMNYSTAIEKKHQQLENEKLQAELVVLKNQVHPHFLFNTLNSLYSLVLKKSDIAQDVILKFSSLLRYILYETNQTTVSLSKELIFIKSYLDLEKIRFGKFLQVNWKESGNYTNSKIAPMILLHFIENSVKHSSSADAVATIEVSINVENNLLKMQVRNSKSPNPVNLQTGGIGLNNVKKRLDILYANNYALTIDDQAEYYLINLTINMANEG